MQDIPQQSVIDACIETFLERNKLPLSYWQDAQKWFIPVFKEIKTHQINANRPLLIGVNGAQGSGKSTFTDLALVYLRNVLGVSCIGFSIDDFYFSKAKRQELARNIHPLLQTRGVPGTHDIAMLRSTLKQLIKGDDCVIPQFNKATDDIKPESDWLESKTAPQIIILEGWCVGSLSCTDASLEDPINELEQEKDTDGIWRTYVNKQLSETYKPLFALIDKLIMLKAPSFECVYQWRVEQEHKMLEQLKENDQDVRGLGMSDRQIANFIAYYQRITEDNLAHMPKFCDYLFDLDSQRKVISCQHN